jgi:hypothetical protein
MAINTDNILSLGDDQAASQFSLVFPNGIPGGGDANAISLRADQTFDPPEDTVNVYDVFHKGFKFTKTGMLQETTKEFTIDVRLDQNWKVYDDLRRWADYSYDHSNGTALSDTFARSTVIVQAEDRTQTAVKRISFYKAKPKSIKIGTFDNASGDPIRITITFIYITMTVA